MDQPTTPLCPSCHQPALSAYYFCPNCGTALQAPPLATTSAAQLKVYAHSIILPSLCFITINRWQGVRYLKSGDEKARRIGIIACALLALSTVVTAWYVVMFTRSLAQSAADNVSADLGGY